MHQKTPDIRKEPDNRMSSNERFRSLLAPVQPPQGLAESILARVEALRIASAKAHFMLDLAVAALSGVAFVLTARMFLAEAALTGAFQYLSLLFTNGTSALTYWQDLLLSFVEAFPALLAAAALATVFVLVLSLQRAVLNGTTAFHRHQAA